MTAGFDHTFSTSSATKKDTLIIVESFDLLLDTCRDALLEVDKDFVLGSESIVRRSNSELKLLEGFGFARDAMMAALCHQDKNRKMLQAMFGGDCVRVSRVRALLTSARLCMSEQCLADRRVGGCLGACQSVEKVLEDLGMSNTLHEAQAQEMKTLNRCRDNTLLRLRADSETAQSVAVRKRNSSRNSRKEDVSSTATDVNTESTRPRQNSITRGSCLFEAITTLEDAQVLNNPTMEDSSTLSSKSIDEKMTTTQSPPRMPIEGEELNATLRILEQPNVTPQQETGPFQPGGKEYVKMPFSGFNSLDASSQLNLKRLHAYYAGYASMGAGTSLSLVRFRRFLRDCGLLGGEGDAHSVAKLRPFAEPPLTLALADVQYVKTLAGVDAEDVGVVQLGNRGSLEAFAEAVASIAVICFPDERTPNGHPSNDAMALMITKVLSPLEGMLPGGNFLTEALAAMVDPEIASVFRRSQHFLGSVFQKYSVSSNELEPYKKGHWDARKVSSWASSLDLVKEVSNHVLHSFYAECSIYEANTLPGAIEYKLTFSGFLLFLMVVALKVYEKKRANPLQRLGALLLRVGGVNRIDLEGGKVAPAWAQAALDADSGISTRISARTPARCSIVGRSQGYAGEATVTNNASVSGSSSQVRVERAPSGKILPANRVRVGNTSQPAARYGSGEALLGRSPRSAPHSSFVARPRN